MRLLALLLVLALPAPAAAQHALMSADDVVRSLRAQRAQSHQHHHTDGDVISGAVGAFYETWMRPDQPGVSCCNRLDCAPVGGVRHLNGKLQALRTKDNVWLTIPAEKIEQRRDSPNISSHMCSMGPSVFCFVQGSGT